MNLSWTSQTHCGVLAPLKSWEEAHPECQLWAVWGGKMRSDGPRRVPLFWESTSRSLPELPLVWQQWKAPQSQAQTVELWQLKAVLPWTASLGLCLSPYLCLHGEGRDSSLGPALLFVCTAVNPSAVILEWLLKGCQQTPQSRLEQPKLKVLPKFVSETGIKKLL